jgi:hypothetical protein
MVAQKFQIPWDNEYQDRTFQWHFANVRMDYSVYVQSMSTSMVYGIALILLFPFHLPFSSHRIILSTTSAIFNHTILHSMRGNVHFKSHLVQEVGCLAGD